MRPADGVRGAAAPRRRHARGGVPVPPMRPRRRTVDESDGDAAGRVAGREDRRDDDRAAAARNGARHDHDGAGRRVCRRDPGPGIRWSTAAEERLARVPNFVRGMVKKIYADYAKERGLVEITPAVMDSARSELGLEGM